MEWVGLRFGLRQLSYQHCFRVGQPASLFYPPLFISDSLLQFSIILLPLLSVFPAWRTPNLPFCSLISILFSVSHRSLLPFSHLVVRLLCAWGMTLPHGPSILAPRPHSFLTAPTLLEPESETSTFTAVRTARAAVWFFLFIFFYLLVLPWRMDVHKHIIIRGWSLRRELPAPKHLTSKLHVCLFLSKGLQLGFEDSIRNFFCRKLSLIAP